MTLSEYQSTLPVSLTPQQLDALSATDGPSLVLAVPGSGKTTVLVGRLGYLVLCENIPPEKILTVTYTVAACKDMRNRAARFFGEELAERIEFRTIHGICSKVIYQYGKSIGKAPFSLASDEKSLSSLLSSIYQSVTHSYATEAELYSLKARITYVKNMLLSPEEIKALGEKEDLPLAEIYARYTAALRERRQMDYDDQLLYAYRILKGSPATLQLFQDAYPYLCVDEAQDTSYIQHEIIRLLARRDRHLFMVGDEDQSIYGFRAAYPEALLSFEKDWPGAKIYLMEENFRSRAEIVDGAATLISFNKDRHAKTMRPVRPSGENAVNVIPVHNRYGQISYLAKVAKGCKRQTAILYRDNECVLPLVDLLESRGIPFNIRSAELTFFTHPIVQDIRDIVALGLSPQDTEAFLRVYYKLGTYLDKQAAQRVVSRVQEGGMTLERAIQADPNIHFRVKKNWRETWSLLKNVRTMDGYDALSMVIHTSGYLDYLEKAQKNSSKLAILLSLARGKKNAKDLFSRLDELHQLLADKAPASGCPLTLSTIHSSKGLEYESVYLLDGQEGVLPNAPLPASPSPADLAAMEEERRLFYVAATRAREHLYFFSYPGTATFRKEFLTRKAQGRLFENYTKELTPGRTVVHKTLGQAEIKDCSLKKGVLSLSCGDRVREFRLASLYEKDLLSFPS